MSQKNLSPPSPLPEAGRGVSKVRSSRSTPTRPWDLRTPNLPPPRLGEGGRGGEVLRRKLFLPLLLAALVAAGCNRAAGPARSGTPAPAEVKLAKPERKVLVRAVEQPGTIQAFEDTPIYAKLPGYVRRVYADIGDRVRGPVRSWFGEELEPGQLLADLYIPEVEEQAAQRQALARQAAAEVQLAHEAVSAARANVAAAEAMIGEAEAGLGRTEANYRRWELENERVAGLVKSKVIDAQIRDETEREFRSARAARDEARAHVTSAQSLRNKARAEQGKSEADVQVADARLQAAQAEARRVEALVGYTKVRAPFDGTITRRRVDTGHFLQPPSGGKAEPLFAVVRFDPVRVFVEVPESDAGLIRDGLPARLRVQALGGEVKGAVTRTSWALDPASRTLRTEIDLPNADGKFRPGMYVTARIESPLPESFVLPAVAVVRQGEAAFCFRVVDGKAVKVAVRVGYSDGKFMQVFQKLKPGTANAWEDFDASEELVATGAATLTDGAAVRVAEGR